MQSNPRKPRVAAHEAWILDCTNKANQPDFLLELDIEREGTEQPKADADPHGSGEVVEQIER